MDDKRLKQLLNRPQVPQGLEEKLKANWADQLTQTTNRWSGARTLAIAASASFAIAILLLNTLFSTPSLVAAAIDDIKNDTRQQFGLVVPIADLSDIEHINMPPDSMPIKMTKYCTIDGNRTFHLKVAGAQQGEVHLFIRHGAMNTAFWQSQQGSVESMPWRLIQPREGLTVLVVYTHDMNPANVEKLIQTMFYA